MPRSSTSAKTAWRVTSVPGRWNSWIRFRKRLRVNFCAVSCARFLQHTRRRRYHACMVLRNLGIVLLFGVPFCAGQDNALPKLERFDPSVVDKSKNPCDGFFQYTCSNWIAAHPIPEDMPVTSVSLPLRLYNQTILRNALEKAAGNAQATGSERQIGDYWRSCMDEAGRNANGKVWLKPHLDAIDSMKSNKEIARVVAYFDLNFP